MSAELLRAIASAPDDDAPRRVYADWLDERGEREAAELIRLQLAYGRPTWRDLDAVARADRCLPTAPPLPGRGDARFALTYRRGLPREASLTAPRGHRETPPRCETLLPALAERAPTLRGLRLSLANGTAGLPLPFEHLERLALTAESLDADALRTTLADLPRLHDVLLVGATSPPAPALLAALPDTLRSLALATHGMPAPGEDVAYAPTDLDPLARMPLRELSILCPLARQHLPRLAPLTGLRRLTLDYTADHAELHALQARHPDLDALTLSLTDGALATFPRWSLRELDLRRTDATGRGLAGLAAAAPPLRDLRVALADRCAEDALAPLTALPLETLALSGRGLGAAHLQPLTGWTTLRALGVTLLQPTRRTAEALGEILASLPALRQLRVRAYQRQPASLLSHLAGLPSLEALDVPDTIASDGAFAALAPGALRGLTRLRVRVSALGSPLTDDGIRDLVRAAPDLRSLELTRSSCTDTGLAHLAELPRLRHLDVSLGAFSPAALTALRQRHDPLILRPDARDARVELPRD